MLPGGPSRQGVAGDEIGGRTETLFNLGNETPAGPDAPVIAIRVPFELVRIAAEAGIAADQIQRQFRAVNGPQAYLPLAGYLVNPVHGHLLAPAQCIQCPAHRIDKSHERIG